MSGGEPVNQAALLQLLLYGGVFVGYPLLFLAVWLLLERHQRRERELEGGGRDG